MSTRREAGRSSRTAGILACLAFLGGASSPASSRANEPGMIDLTGAVLLVPPSQGGVEKKAVALLEEDVARRSGVHWKVSTSRPVGGGPIVVVSPLATAGSLAGELAGSLSRDAQPPAEGFEIHTRANPPAIVVAGNDPRGILFGVGRLLRELQTAPAKVALPVGFNLKTSPKVPLRGHQLGYRPKTNAYDAWDVPRWERYIRDLAIFGTNAVELIPPRSDDDARSPLFPRPPMEMMVEMSRLLDEYGMDVWIWYPAMDPDYTNPSTIAAALEEWGEVFRKLPRIDAIFVPGGDPGHTEPRVLMPFLARVTEVLHRYHPKATMWMSPQGFNKPWLDQFLGIMKENPPWLTGLVHGPQIRISLAELRKAIPAKYPIRSYPDITHSRQCQFPVPDWDLAFAMTESREIINPRPTQQAAIFKYYQPPAMGFLTYSEGCNDDVNKFVWSGLGWDPDAEVREILCQYARAFIGDAPAESFAEGLLGLERNWRGPLLTNESISPTLARFQELERVASPELRANWRFQQALYRAHYDAYLRDRLAYETRQESDAYRELGAVRASGSRAVMEAASRYLKPPSFAPGGPPGRWRTRVFELADDLFTSIRMQQSVGLYNAISVDRGASLDTIDVPLNDRLWLRSQLASIERLPTEESRVSAIEAILHRTDPGPGGFYDDLGNLTRQPHLVRPLAYAEDPDFRRSPMVGFGSAAGWPLAWCQNAQSLLDAPLSVRYDTLDPKASYKVRVVYAGDSFRNLIRLDAEGAEVHGWYQKPEPPRPVEFDIPAKATADRSLTLTWRQEPGKGGNGRGCQVAEVWLIPSRTEREAEK